MTSFEWPSFRREPLRALASNTPAQSWSATFDSYDQYRDDCYYLVQLFLNAPPGGGVDVEADRAIGELMVKVSMDFAPGDDWSTPEFVAELRARIADVAATGETNTTHTQ